ncbi:hypothetical protein F5051DRAFT_446884 [Lentinula edodes]|nr:hypothetical protein F5051DRAFT_446884 [Lentinula edodes]
MLVAPGESPWCMEYSATIRHKGMKTLIYTFTWEDPEVDIQHLDITSSDSVLAITSAGDNVLHYAIASSPRNLHCVDMNPCQGHLLELKLAAISSLEYFDFFALFGRGYHPRFRDLLDSKLEHCLSIYAYEFWKVNASAFSSSTFYDWGYSGRVCGSLRRS